MSVVERSFPERCPSCTMPTAVTANPHCASPTCSWLRCQCDAVFNKAGRVLAIETGDAT